MRHGLHDGLSASYFKGSGYLYYQHDCQRFRHLRNRPGSRGYAYFGPGGGSFRNQPPDSGAGLPPGRWNLRIRPASRRLPDALHRGGGHPLRPVDEILRKAVGNVDRGGLRHHDGMRGDRVLDFDNPTTNA